MRDPFPQDALARAAALGAATLHEAAGRIGALPSSIKPLVPSMKIAGPAFTVQVPQLDNLWIHRALYEAEPGDVLVVITDGGVEGGYWGDILNEAAVAAALGGLVIAGGVRDTARLVEMSFPVFSQGICIRGTKKGYEVPSGTRRPIAFGDVSVQCGDLVVGDRDGVVVIPRGIVGAALRAGEDREREEAEKIRQIRNGERTIDIYGFGDGRS